MDQERHLRLVDDSALVTNALRVLFEAQGYRVSVAGSVADAVRQERADPADVMLLDLTLSDGDGLLVLSALDCDAPPTIALTGHDDDAIRERCQLAGCRQLLVKPVPMAELLAQVQSIETARR